MREGRLALAEKATTRGRDTRLTSGLPETTPGLEGCDGGFGAPVVTRGARCAKLGPAADPYSARWFWPGR
ncbi:hypothetical protein GCM10007886_27130 [Methylobacterium gregans]|nr:hypothetical protein GCM10007886_27130 [Methylobacterium gregans]